jgi:hypothetical protein
MGIQVESIKAGDGKHYPAKRQTVTVDYVGYLDKAGEKKFDSTFERGAVFPDRARRGIAVCRTRARNAAGAECRSCCSAAVSGCLCDVPLLWPAPGLTRPTD